MASTPNSQPSDKYRGCFIGLGVIFLLIIGLNLFLRSPGLKEVKRELERVRNMEEPCIKAHLRIASSLQANWIMQPNRLRDLHDYCSKMGNQLVDVFAEDAWIAVLKETELQRNLSWAKYVSTDSN